MNLISRIFMLLHLAHSRRYLLCLPIRAQTYRMRRRWAELESKETYRALKPQYNHQLAKFVGLITLLISLVELIKNSLAEISY